MNDKNPKMCFWEKYESSDYFERREMLKKVSLLNTLVKYRKDYDDETWEYDFYTRIQSYIDDVIEYMDEKEAIRNGVDV